MRIVTGCLKPTPTELLPVLSGIAPAALRRENYTYRRVSKASQDPNHLLHKLVSDSQDHGRQRLPSAARSPATQHSLLAPISNTLQAWRTSWQRTPRPPPPPQLSVTPYTSYHWALTFLQGLGNTESATDWIWPIQCQYAPLGSAPISSLPMRSEEQTDHHIIHECPTFPHPTIWTSKTWLQRLSDTASRLHTKEEKTFDTVCIIYHINIYCDVSFLFYFYFKCDTKKYINYVCNVFIVT